MRNNFPEIWRLGMAFKEIEQAISGEPMPKWTSLEQSAQRCDKLRDDPSKLCELISCPYLLELSDHLLLFCTM
jgi:hypothetical protein